MNSCNSSLQTRWIILHTYFFLLFWGRIYFGLYLWYSEATHSTLLIIQWYIFQVPSGCSELNAGTLPSCKAYAAAYWIIISPLTPQIFISSLCISITLIWWQAWSSMFQFFSALMPFLEKLIHDLKVLYMPNALQCLSNPDLSSKT